MKRKEVIAISVLLEDGEGFVLAAGETQSGMWWVEHDAAIDNPARDGGGVLLWEEHEIRWHTKPQRRQESR